jgi:cytochrome c oxidase subunit 4
MHVRYGSPLLRVFAAGGFLWLVILFLLMLPDYLTRH